MKLCFYCTTGTDFKTFGFKVIEDLEFKDYVVKVIEINTLNGLISFRNMVNHELILTDSFNVIRYKKKTKIIRLNLLISF